MPRRAWWGAARVVWVGLFVAAPAWAQGAGGEQARVKALLDSLDDLFRSTSSRVVMTMRVKTANYERSMSMESWSKGKDRSLVRLLTPIKEKGTSTLMSGKEIYTYLPKTDRTIRISSGMRGGAWRGSHITNDDLIKSSRLAEDYTYKITFEGKRGGQDVIEITLIPKEDAAVTWGRIVSVMRAEDKMPVSQSFFDEDGKEMRRMIFSQIKEIGGRKMPAVLRVEPVDKPGEFTEVIYTEAEFDLDVSDGIFSLNNLKRN